MNQITIIHTQTYIDVIAVVLHLLNSFQYLPGSLQRLIRKKEECEYVLNAIAVNSWQTAGEKQNKYICNI